LATGRQEERVQEGGGAGEEKRRFSDGSADELTRGFAGWMARGVGRLGGCGEEGWGGWGDGRSQKGRGARCNIPSWKAAPMSRLGASAAG